MTDAQTTTMPDVTTADEQTINSDFTCINCDYNLRTIKRSGDCPECGTAVRKSLNGDLYDETDQSWLRSIHWGVRVFALSYCISLFYSPVRYFIGITTDQYYHYSPDDYDIFWSIHCVMLIACLVTATLTLAKYQLGNGSNSYNRISTMVRLSCALTVVATLFQQAVHWAAGLNSASNYVLMNHSVFVYSNFVAILIGTAGTMIGCLILLSRLAKRIPDRRLTRQLSKVIVWTILFHCLLIISYPIRFISGDSIYDSYQEGEIVRALGDNIGRIVEFYVLLAVIALSGLIKQILNVKNSHTINDDEYEPGSQINQVFSQLNRKNTSRTRWGLNLLKWSIIFLLYGLTGMLDAASLRGADFIIIFIYAAILLSIILFGIGILLTARQMKNKAGQTIQAGMKPFVIPFLGGLGIITAIGFVVGALLDAMDYITMSNDFLIGLGIIGLIICISCILSLTNHLRWLAAAVKCHSLVWQFRWLLGASFITASMLVICLLIDLSNRSWMFMAMELVGIYILIAAMMIACGGLVLIDQLWREFDRARLVMGK